MIERYSLPEMKSVWSDENKYRKWLEVEIAACGAWAAQGVIPSGDIEKLKTAYMHKEDTSKTNAIYIFTGLFQCIQSFVVLWRFILYF